MASKVGRGNLRPMTERRRAELRKRLPRADTAFAIVDRKGLVKVAKPFATQPGCASPLVSSSGTQKATSGMTTHAGPGYSYVTYICYGQKFGGVAATSFTATATGFDFSGAQYFCFAEKCSNGQGANFSSTLSGSVKTSGSVATIDMIYECSALCGGTVVCVESGSFVGTLAPGQTDPLHADYIGDYVWTLVCCPDVKWGGFPIG